MASKSNQKTFQGDSGGPMVCRAGTRRNPRGEKYLTGIVSFGPNKCGVKEMPGVYTKVSSFAKFINKLKDKVTFHRLKVQNQTMEIDIVNEDEQ
jgi:secreted trypsin-like serine protease